MLGLVIVARERKVGWGEAGGGREKKEGMLGLVWFWFVCYYLLSVSLNMKCVCC